MSGAPTYPTATVAKLLLLTPRRLQQLRSEGHLPKGERGRWELAPTVQAYIRYLRDRTVSADAEGEVDHKKRLLKARADLAEIEAAERRAELIPVRVAEAAWSEVVARMRARLVSIPSKAAPVVAVESEPAEVHAVLEGFVREALAEISETPLAEAGSGPEGDGRADAGRAGRGRASAAADDRGVG